MEFFPALIGSFLTKLRLILQLGKSCFQAEDPPYYTCTYVHSMYIQHQTILPVPKPLVLSFHVDCGFCTNMKQGAPSPMYPQNPAGWGLSYTDGRQHGKPGNSTMVSVFPMGLSGCFARRGVTHRVREAHSIFVFQGLSSIPHVFI